MAKFWSVPVWIIPSRTRPHNLRRLVAACSETLMTTRALLRLDDDDPLLRDYLRMETDWEIVVDKRVPLSEVYNEVFPRHLDWYGFLADDVLPETLNWDSTLIDAAGPDGMAYGDDGIHQAPTHFVLGGDLVRDIGWLALPGLDRLYIDTVWKDIATDREVLRYLPDVKITHLHFSNRRAMRDAIYRKPTKDNDRALYEAWRKEVE